MKTPPEESSLTRLRPPLAATLSLVLLAACAASPPPALPAPEAHGVDRAALVRTAREMIGTPYRYGGRSPRGFDCSGLVVYSYAQAGLEGLPHSAAALWRASRDISLREIEPGDLLFFRLDGPKVTHVGIYVGHRSFVHAPSAGKRVEAVSFDDVYWGSKLEHAGRLLP